MSGGSPPPVMCVLGLGEAGSRIAPDLAAAGAIVHAFDPKVRALAGIKGFASDADAARGASIIMALTSAHDAVETLELALPGLADGAIYADLNTASVLGALGASVTVLDGPPGVAATRKLLRSVFYKGLAAAVTEALRAGGAAGCEDWLRNDIAQVLAEASTATVDRLEQGSIRHARRRVDEMTTAGELLEELGVPARVTRASQGWLEQLVAENLH